MVSTGCNEVDTFVEKIEHVVPEIKKEIFGHGKKAFNDHGKKSYDTKDYGHGNYNTGY